jgi:hypothetical protein
MAGGNDQQQARVSVTGPRFLLVAVISLVAGGGVAAATTGVTQGKPPQTAALPWLTKPEVESIARDQAAAAEVRAAENCRRDLAASHALVVQQVGQIATLIEHIDTKLDGVQGKLSDVQSDVAGLKATSRRRP